MLNFHHQNANYDYMKIIGENLNLPIITIYLSNNVDYIEPNSRSLRNHTNSKKLFSISNQLLGRISLRVLPNEPITTLIDTFDQYFNTKVMNIIKSLPTPLNKPYNLPLYSLSSFTLSSTTTIEKLLSAVNTSSELDPIPHSILN